MRQPFELRDAEIKVNVKKQNWTSNRLMNSKSISFISLDLTSFLFIFCEDARLLTKKKMKNEFTSWSAYYSWNIFVLSEAHIRSSQQILIVVFWERGEIDSVNPYVVYCFCRFQLHEHSKRISSCTKVCICVCPSAQSICSFSEFCFLVLHDRWQMADQHTKERLKSVNVTSCFPLAWRDPLVHVSVFPVLIELDNDFQTSSRDLFEIRDYP